MLKPQHRLHGSVGNCLSRFTNHNRLSASSVTSYPPLPLLIAKRVRTSQERGPAGFIDTESWMSLRGVLADTFVVLAYTIHSLCRRIDDTATPALPDPRYSD